ncbi:ATP-binding protein [Pandoraea commovens]|uniref:histidine kinase n=1 Tax=Pandoraea commovens TaxID=2508289 RepID=A0A5E4RH15_9BURK|nr:ATP-binding protein [Pandoraea commovens]UVA81893.1 ATP-binding protein [Pandoraea commovens]VVD62487.1 two-component sensor histidine kinase [Pandoraea commovens]
MDGLKGRLNDSIRLRLSLWLSIAILVFAVIAGVISFGAAFDEAHELQDDVLRQVAALVDNNNLPASEFRNIQAPQTSGEDARVVVQRLAMAPPPGSGVSDGDDKLPLPLTLTMPDGLATVMVGGEPYRVFAKTLKSGERIAVAQETDVRDEIARTSAIRTVMPLVAFVPVLLLVVGWLVRRIFRPVASLSREIDQRQYSELHAVPTEHLPNEIRPFLQAINNLLSRVATSVDAQHRFVADAAHELRTPLTALSLQAERLADAPMSETASERLIELRHGIERSRHLLDHLLTLSSVQATQRDAQAYTNSVLTVFRHTLETLYPLAEAKQIDIGIDEHGDVALPVSEADLGVLMKNLVDNAIRYTPAGGRIDLVLESNGWQTVLSVRDTGPGIEPQERERVFDPFYRILGTVQTGSGLGLSIVKAIADKFGARVHFAYTDESTRRGLSVSVIVPNALVMNQEGRGS